MYEQKPRFLSLVPHLLVSVLVLNVYVYLNKNLQNQMTLLLGHANFKYEFWLSVVSAKLYLDT